MANPTSPDTDTIAAIATPAGRGGIGIVRLSGPRALSIGRQLTGTRLIARHAHYRHFTRVGHKDTIIDSGIALYFPAPHSFTGEDVVELQGHGGPIVMDMLLQACCEMGARQARAGEFSERAYLNDKIDLTQAEAMADLINSTTEAAARNANRSLRGNFAKEIDKLLKLVVNLRVYVEAAIDFPEEEIDFIEEGGVLQRLLTIIEQVEEVVHTAKQGSLMSEGIRLVIAGKPNAGKSSLLNALSGDEAAIVTPIAGTTRDVLREHIEIDGLPFHLIDTAGLRDKPEEIEREGIRRARLEIEAADHVLVVIDSTQVNDPAEVIAEVPENTAVTYVYNKCDLSGTDVSASTIGGETRVYLSAKTGEGIELLQQHLKTSAGFSSAESGQFSARRRHLDALRLTQKALESACGQLQSGGAGELLAEDLRQCQQYLGEICGTFTSDALLGEIFSSFCIGK